MGYLEQLISSGIFLTLKQKYDQGYNISKNELRTLIESCKRSHEHGVDTLPMLSEEQKRQRKHLFSKAADATKDYVEQCLRDENRLDE